ncbi:MAG: hypothetical protein Q4D79_02830 [Propionibacteriaceae bacterium]|nr:hypothetical protein [Propionibacteriaceae bacterium]
MKNSVKFLLALMFVASFGLVGGQDRVWAVGEDPAAAPGVEALDPVFSLAALPDTQGGGQ